jgi:glycosyltransferase involved in cell wall biosynthesis
MGGNSHVPDLEYISPVLLGLMERYPQRIRFHFFGAKPPEQMAALVQVKWTPFMACSYKDFAAFFQTQTADIFIAPLVDNLFNRCKSPIKFFEYNALGVPGVFSRLETYTDVVVHGQNGLLASSLDDWTNALIQLIEDKELRYSLAGNAQETIRSNWLLSQNAFRWKETFQKTDFEIANREPKTPTVNILESINLQLVEVYHHKEAKIQTLTTKVSGMGQTIETLKLENGQKVESLMTQVLETERVNAVLIAQAADLQQAAAALKVQTAEKEQTWANILNAQVSEKEQAVTAATTLTAQLNEIQSSTAWRLIQLLWNIRTAIIPHGSRRERLLYLVMRPALYLKRYGVRSFFHRTAEKLKNQGVTSLINPPPDLFGIVAQDGKLCPVPAISIVIEKNTGHDLPTVTEAEVLAWAAAQTLSWIEVVEWESDTRKAYTLTEPTRSWEAASLEELCRDLTGRYLCMASADLLQRNRVYLETNLIALESEGLAFTLNGLGRSDWLLVPLRNNYLPGDRQLPYLRQVIRTDCVRNDFSVDISSFILERQDKPVVAGKIIVHTTTYPDKDDPYPAENLLAENVEWSLKGNYILSRSNPQIPWEPLTHVIHPVNTVIPVLPELSDLPTIIVFMPFLAVGGAERLVLQLIRHLQKQARFIVVTIEGMEAALGTTSDAFQQTIPFVYTAADYLLSPLNYSFLVYLIERFQADTFYIANGSNFIYDALGTLRSHYPELRIVDQVYDHQFGWINRYDQVVAASMDALISANPNITRAYTEHGVRPDRIHFVEHAINLEDVNPADYSIERCIQIKKKLGLPLDRKIVTFCARIHPQKRPLDFIELARRFSSDDGIHFLMVGDGPLATAVEEQVTRTGLKNFTRCKFYTPISEIYAITDVMVLPSEYEAMPLVILESLAMGKPVVATDVGHIRDVVEMTHGGVVVQNIGDVAALRMGVIKALSEPVDSTFMRQIIAERFGISHIATQYLKVWLGE